MKSFYYFGPIISDSRDENYNQDITTEETFLQSKIPKGQQYSNFQFTDAEISVLNDIKNESEEVIENKSQIDNENSSGIDIEYKSQEDFDIKVIKNIRKEDINDILNKYQEAQNKLNEIISQSSESEPFIEEVKKNYQILSNYETFLCDREKEIKEKIELVKYTESKRQKRAVISPINGTITISKNMAFRDVAHAANRQNSPFSTIPKGKALKTKSQMTLKPFDKPDKSAQNKGINTHQKNNLQRSSSLARSETPQTEPKPKSRILPRSISSPSGITTPTWNIHGGDDKILNNTINFNIK